VSGVVPASLNLGFSMVANRISLSFLSRPATLRGGRLAAAGLVGLGLVAGSVPAVAQFQSNNSVQTPFGRAPLSFADIVDRVKPSVVSIHVTGGGKRVAQNAPNQNPGQRGPQTPRNAPQMPQGTPEELRKFFEEFFGRGAPGGPGGSPMPSLAQGSGFVISEDGYIVTNNHVVENGTKFEVSFDEQSKIEASLVGTDQRTDLALLKIKDPGSRRFPAVKFAQKDARVGDWVLAVGNPFGLGGTVTAGIVSALARDVGSGPYDFLQIDAAVNRGNSGGPTFNLEGEVIGVNTAIFSPSGGNVGIAFAVPSRTAQDVIGQLRSSGTVSRGWLGVVIQSVDDDMASALGVNGKKGALIKDVTAGGPAASSGLKNGDLILSINGDTINDSRDLARKVASFAPNSSIDVRVLRSGREQSIPVKLGDFKNSQAAAASPGENRPEPTKPVTTVPNELGLTFGPQTNARGTREGLAIASVEAASDAASKGLRAGDIVLEVASQSVQTAEDFEKALAAVKKEGRRAVLLRVKSGNETRFVAVQLKRG
jgi:serine protease Do